MAKIISKLKFYSKELIVAIKRATPQFKTVDEHYQERFKKKMVLFENKKFVNNLNYRATNISMAFKNSNIEIWIDPKTNRIIDHKQYSDKSKIVRLNSAKRVEAMEREYMIHTQIEKNNKRITRHVAKAFNLI